MLKFLIAFLCVVHVDKVIYGALDADFPCAAGLSDLVPLIPPDRFPSFIPSGVNVCDATCSDLSTCTYNWLDSLEEIPFLLFRCYCHGQVPPKPQMLYGDFLKITCNEVTSNPVLSRCTCRPGQRSYKCTFDLIPPRDINNYYCACW